MQALPQLAPRVILSVSGHAESHEVLLRCTFSAIVLSVRVLPTNFETQHIKYRFAILEMNLSTNPFCIGSGL